jgi:hypothetical protein
LDWAVADEVKAEDPDDPASPLRIPIMGVAHVRLPTSLVFDVLQGLNKAMTRYESIFGEIRRPEHSDRDEADLHVGVEAHPSPVPAGKRVRYRDRPLPPGWTRYRLTIPAGKDRPDLEAV